MPAIDIHQRSRSPGRQPPARVPVMHGGDRAFHQPGRTAHAAEIVDDVSDALHDAEYTNIEDRLVKPESTFFELALSRPHVHLAHMDDRDLIRRALKERGLTQQDLARELCVSVASVGRLLRKERRLAATERDRAFAWLGISPAPLRHAPVIGLVAAGHWREAVQDPLGYIWCEVGGPNTFALRVEGDSMNLLIPEGGYVAVDPDDRDLVAGRVYVVMNGDGEATVKKYSENPARLVPMSDNPAHHEIRLGTEPVVVVGRVIWKAERL